MVSVSFSVSEVYSPGHRHIRSLPVSLEIRDHRRIVPLRRSDKTADFPSGCVDQKGGRQTGYTECSRGPATVVKIGREVLDLGIPKESLDHGHAGPVNRKRDNLKPLPAKSGLEPVERWPFLPAG